MWVGTNAITIYMVFHLIEFQKFAERIVGGPVKAFFGPWGPLLVSVTVVAMMLALVRFLYQRKIFLRL